MNEKESFIIEDLDDHHVVIKADEEWRVRRDLEAEDVTTGRQHVVVTPLCASLVQPFAAMARAYNHPAFIQDQLDYDILSNAELLDVNSPVKVVGRP
ncbi:hypothetical protein A0H81_01692 [Grifola frondosa]|uniref:General transcription and DNA repair factor IIH subunit TFB5 n=1 Tax=Grifola frondosa TaxID=5627 RepID=A0A1C7MLJ4_GRIFR|nr:hypothetical protein A0H81_01692 [Grifola frondosa]